MLTKDWVATAPTWACAHGTAVPTEKYRDCTATPRFLVLGSKAAIEKVEAKWFSLSMRTSLCGFLFYVFLKAARVYSQNEKRHRVCSFSFRRSFC